MSPALQSSRISSCPTRLPVSQGTIAPTDETLFSAALALPEGDRGGYLDRMCQGNRLRRGRIEALLRAHERASDFMEYRLPDLARAAAMERDLPGEEQAGDWLGRYRLVRRIGEGGCGVVYQAEQHEPVRRSVALKVIKLGMDTKAVIARFEAERQALARMEHPHIARVLDAGATAAGRPFFVMELVRGERITDFCDRHRLGVSERLHLFVKVCQAVQHAHQKGIIHRDLKPSNILVTMGDGEAVPKVIDFGIAKATQGRLTDATLCTGVEQFIGTPAYVSPEQATMGGADLDTRSDIYSLGVLLHELLTGCTPFDSRRLLEAGLDGMRRIIREQEPLRPSQRLLGLPVDEAALVAQGRGSDPARLAGRLDGDLDWIVLCCLEKDRARRYATANALAMDVQRHLRHEPVLARPPQPWYVVGKLIRRHRLAFAAGAALVLSLAAGLAVSTVLFVRTRAEKQRMHEEAARRTRLATAMAGTLKDIGLHVSLAAGDRRMLDEMIARTIVLKKEFADQPDMAAGVDETLGGVCFQVGDLGRAEAFFNEALRRRRRAHGDDSPEAALTLNYLARIHSAQARWAEAAESHLDALRIQQQQFGREHPEVARTLSTMGWVLAQQARLGEAEHYLRVALGQQRLLGAPADVAVTLTRLGSVLMQEGRLPEAETALNEALLINRGVFGRDSLEAAGSLHALAITVALTQARLPEAIQLYREALDIRERLSQAAGAARGRPARAGAAAGSSIEALLSPRGALAQVESALREAQTYASQHYARDSWEEAFHHALRVWVLLQEERFEDAEPIARQCLAVREKLRPDDWSTHHARHLLGAVLAGLGRSREAEPLLLEGYAGMKARAADIPPFHHARLAESAQRLARFYADGGRVDAAAEWRAEAERLKAEG